MKLNPFKLLSFKNRGVWGILTGIALSVCVFLFAYTEVKRTSTNEYCESCHVHPQATETWTIGPHVKNSSGVAVQCVQCHLPPDGMDHYVEKAKAGARDLYSFYFRDVSAIDWEERSTLEYAANHTFDASCSKCHVELFPKEISSKGVDAHLHYKKNMEDLRCINCHLKTGHFHEGAEEQFVVLEDEAKEEVELAPLVTELEPGAFVDYTEVLPGSEVKFEMVAVQGGTFSIGSPESEPGREADEGPQREVAISPFWMGKFEVSWREFDTYYSQTVTRGKNEKGETSDAITGPTPPYGSPEQGWGKGSRPAITMTHYSARKYCEWLSAVTGRSYRLPTEAEWEYAARGGTKGAYFFDEEASSSWLTSLTQKLMGGWGVNEELLSEYAWHQGNSKRKTYPQRTNKPNPLGIFNLFGNVKEYCADWYGADTYASYSEGQPVKDPTGPASGEEHVVRGGSFKSSPVELRSAARDRTYHDAWIKTDPQNPKSVWWYSDTNEVGFRVVRVLSEEKKQ